MDGWIPGRKMWISIFILLPACQVHHQTIENFYPKPGCEVANPPGIINLSYSPCKNINKKQNSEFTKTHVFINKKGQGWRKGIKNNKRGKKEKKIDPKMATEQKNVGMDKKDYKKKKTRMREDPIKEE